MGMEWIVAAVLLVAGIVAAIGFYLGERDPIVRRYKPSFSGLLGRMSMRPMQGAEPEKPADQPRANKS
jgi:hypothetical protein